MSEFEIIVSGFRIIYVFATDGCNIIIQSEDERLKVWAPESESEVGMDLPHVINNGHLVQVGYVVDNGYIVFFNGKASEYAWGKSNHSALLGREKDYIDLCDRIRSAFGSFEQFLLECGGV